ncbi:Uncharacterised protein [uncultured archaeon]|nr:Uncharacterised protein [uncultured archaeon]
MVEEYYCDKLKRNLTVDEVETSECLQIKRRHKCVGEHSLNVCPHISKVINGTNEPVIDRGFPHCSKAKWCGYKICQTGCFYAGKCDYKQFFKKGKKQAIPA